MLAFHNHHPGSRAQNTKNAMCTHSEGPYRNSPFCRIKVVGGTAYSLDAAERRLILDCDCQEFMACTAQTRGA